MAKSVILAAALLLALAASASAQCIQCNACSTSTCWSVCKPNCQTAYPAATCEGAGYNKGVSVAKDTCSFLLTYCSQTSSPKPSPRGFNPVTLQQCQNIFLGSCVQNAKKTVQNTALTPADCKKGLSSGYKACTKEVFNSLFDQNNLELCTKAASAYKP